VKSLWVEENFSLFLSSKLFLVNNFLVNPEVIIVFIMETVKKELCCEKV